MKPDTDKFFHYIQKFRSLATIKQALFWLALCAISVLIVGSFVPSAASLYDYAREQGFSHTWAFFYPVILDGAVICSHASALWLGVSGFPTARAMMLVWTFSFISILSNVAHAPTETSTAFLLPYLEYPVYFSQLMGAMPPLLLVCSFDLTMHIIKRAIRLLSEAEERDISEKCPQMSDKPKHDPTENLDAQKSAEVRRYKQEERQRELYRLRKENPDLSTKELAGIFNVTEKTIKRDLEQLEAA